MSNGGKPFLDVVHQTLRKENTKQHRGQKLFLTVIMKHKANHHTAFANSKKCRNNC